MKYHEWVKELEKAIGDPIIDDTLTHSYLIKQSMKWTSCAVGAKLMCDLGMNNLKDERYIDHYLKSNVSEDIINMGMGTFPHQIRYGQYRKALETLNKIYNTKNIHKSWYKKMEFRIGQYLR